MRKILLLILTVALATPTFAQFETNRGRSRYNHDDTESYYGLRLGLNVSMLSSNIAQYDMDAYAGLAFGAIYGLQLANSAPVWLETGLFFSQKGGKSDYNNEEVKCRMNFLQVPLVCKYTVEAADDLFLAPFVGGYVACGVGGKTKNYATRSSVSSFSDVNRWDAGLRIGCGLEYQMVYGEFGFDFGLANLSKDDFQTVRTRNLFVNVGVNF